MTQQVTNGKTLVGEMSDLAMRRLHVVHRVLLDLISAAAPEGSKDHLRRQHIALWERVKDAIELLLGRTPDHVCEATFRINVAAVIHETVGDRVLSPIS